MAVVVLWSMSLVTLLLLAGHGPWSGRTIVSVTDVHGLNVGDLVPLGAWVVVAACCVWLWRDAD